MPWSSKAVSYTHLDVYKRQIKAYAEAAEGGAGLIFMEDVYKRQG